MKIEYTLSKATKYEIKEDSTYGTYFCSENDSPITDTTISLFDSSTDYLTEEKIYLQLANANNMELALAFCNKYGSVQFIHPTAKTIHLYLERGVYNANDLTLSHDYILYKHFKFYQLSMHHLVSMYNLIHQKSYSLNDLVSLFQHSIDIMINPYFEDFFGLEYDDPTDRGSMKSVLKNYPLMLFLYYASTYMGKSCFKMEIKDSTTGKTFTQPYYEYHYQTISVELLKDSITKFPIQSLGNFISATFDYDLKDKSSITLNYIRTNQEQFISLAKYIFSEFLSYLIRDTIPIVSFDTFDNISSWKFNSLANAIFFYFYMDCSNGNIYKRCANDYCQKLFACSPAYTRKIYCSPNCAHKVANRKWKQNKKALTNQQK